MINDKSNILGRLGNFLAPSLGIFSALFLLMPDLGFGDANAFRLCWGFGMLVVLCLWLTLQERRLLWPKFWVFGLIALPVVGALPGTWVAGRLGPEFLPALGLGLLGWVWFGISFALTPHPLPDPTLESTLGWSLAGVSVAGWAATWGWVPWAWGSAEALSALWLLALPWLALRSIPSATWKPRLLFLLVLVSWIWIGNRAALFFGVLGLGSFGIGWVWLGQPWRRQAWWILGSALSLGLLAWALWGVPPWERLLSLQQFQSASGHLLPWSMAWQAFLAKPWWGHGLGSSLSLLQQYFPPDGWLLHPDPNFPNFRSGLLQSLAEGGLFGFCASLLWALVLSWKLLALLRKPHDSQEKTLALALLVGLWAMGGFALVSAALLSPLVWLALMTLAAMAFRLSNLAPARKQPPAWLLLGFTTLCALALTPLWLDQWAWGQLRPRLSSSEEMVQAEAYLQLQEFGGDTQQIPALYALARFQTEELEGLGFAATAAKIEAQVPHYRSLDSLKLQNRRQSGEAYRSMLDGLTLLGRNGYDPKLLHQLTQLSLEFEDPKLFVEMMRRHLTLLAHQEGLVRPWENQGVEVRFPMNPQWRFEPLPHGLLIEIPLPMLSDLYRQGKEARQANQNPPDPELLELEWGGVLSALPFFQMQRQGKPLTDEALVKQYQEILQLELAAARLQQTRQTESDAAASLASIQREIKAKEKYLSQAINYPQFRQRQEFARRWLAELKLMIYP